MKAACGNVYTPSILKWDRIALLDLLLLSVMYPCDINLL